MTILSPTLIKSSQITNNEELEELRKEVFKHLRIPWTYLQRSYPPVGCNETMSSRGKRTDEEVAALTKKLLQFYNTDSSSPQPIKNSDLEKDYSLERKLIAIIRRIFPTLKNLTDNMKRKYISCYLDKDIIQVHDIIQTKDIKGVTIQYTMHDKPIIQQQATNASGSTALAMLFYENCQKINPWMLSAKCSGFSDMEDLIIWKNSNLKYLSTYCNSLEELQQLLKKDGSAIVVVFTPRGGHSNVVIVDAITDKSVRIRDPYHGWEVDIEITAFENSMFCRGRKTLPSRYNGTRRNKASVIQVK